MDAVDAFLAHHLHLHPVDATFMGVEGYDHLLPPTAAGVEGRELREAAALSAGDPATHRLDRRMMAAQSAVSRTLAAAAPRFANPAWYTGEAAFALVGLMLPQSVPVRLPALLSRIDALPDFFADARTRLAALPTPQGWVARARREAAAMARFLAGDVALHPDWTLEWQAPCARAGVAFAEFAAAIVDLPDRSPACGAAHIAAIMREGHALGPSPATATAQAQAAFDRIGEELVEMAARIDPSRSWADQIAALALTGPAEPAAALAQYRHWHDRAIAAAEGLVTGERQYGLDYRWMQTCFRNLASELYFLFYRSPPGLAARQGSAYWVSSATGPGAHNVAAVKTTHAVHHGSIGHHTQNARARVAPSRLARIAGTDCALGLAFLSAGTMVEGWACYATDLLMEAPEFYTPGEMLLLKHGERRNAASVLVDIRLHTGEWSPEAAAGFYREQAGFPAARVEGEIVRNGMLPGTRLMYWLGVEAIKALRQRWRGTARAFHDTLLGHGHVPLSFVGDEMVSAGQLD